MPYNENNNLAVVILKAIVSLIKNLFKIK